MLAKTPQIVLSMVLIYLNFNTLPELNTEVSGDKLYYSLLNNEAAFGWRSNFFLFNMEYA